jgi:hypothetical protein
MTAAGLMTHEYVTDARLHEGVVRGEVGSPGVAEDDVHALGP